MDYSIFVEELNKVGINISDRQIKLLDKYFKILVQENEKYNLTALTTKQDVFYKHFFDSLAVAKFVDFKRQSICDVGSGAGFPSIPLKIIFDDLQVTIIDALGKRINFLKMLCKELELDVECIHVRAEDFAKQRRESFDFVTARAVANLQVLSELCIPLVKISGNFFVLKGSNGFEELEDANNAISKLGCQTVGSYEYMLPMDYGLRTFFMFEKIRSTPDKYPRNFGQIKNKPL